MLVLKDCLLLLLGLFGLRKLLLDHFGLMGFSVHPAGWGRITGGLLMIAGVALIARF